MIFFTIPHFFEDGFDMRACTDAIEEMVDLFDCRLIGHMANVNKNIDKKSGKQ